MQSSSLHLRHVFRSLISAVLVLLIVMFPAWQPVFASCAPAATNSGDIINCTNANDTINALAGDDQVNAGAGNDTITGGAGNDVLTGGSGNDSYLFDTDSALGTDTVTEASGGGTDTLNFTGSSNALAVDLAVTGNQFVNSNLTLNLTAAQVENITGGTGNDVLTGNNLNNAINGGNGNNTISGAGGNDTLTGGTGADVFVFDTDNALGRDVVNGGTGTDTLDFSSSTAGVTVNLGTTAADQTANSNLILRLSANLENVTGGSGSDTLTGSTAANTLFGGNGNDILDGGTGNDTLSGGAGDDSLTGGAGNDSFVFDTNTALGTDSVAEASGGGTDTLSFSGSNNDIAVDLNTVGNQAVNGNLTLNMIAAQVENITGGNGNDTLTGNSLVNVLSGGNGDDVLTGGTGNDTLNGGAGTDRILQTVDANQTLTNTSVTGTGTDTLSGIEDAILTGGASNNTFTVSGWTGSATLDGAAGTDTVLSSNDADFLLTNALLTRSTGGVFTLTSIEGANLTGGNGSNSLDGSAFTSGIVTLSGGNGNDTLLGGSQNDSLTGGNGDDTLTGGSGNDTLAGSAGNDTYVFAGTVLGTDTLNEAANADSDTLDFSAFTPGATINLSSTATQTVNAGNLSLRLQANTSLENVIGSAGADTITGNTRDNVFTGGGGNDILSGATGNDTYNFDTDTALGVDTVTEASGGGTDTLDFSGSTNAITVNLGTTGNQAVNGNLTLNMTAAQVENITGGSNNDILTGNALDNVFLGGAGNDTYAFNTNSALGADIVTEAVGGDTDTLDFSGSTNAISVNLGTIGSQAVNGNLTLNMTAVAVENVTGGSNNDTFTGNSLDNVFVGGAGNDTYLFNTNSALGTDTVTEVAGGGTDTLDFSSSSNALTVDLGTTGNQVVNGNLTLNMTAAQVENVTGGTNDDTLSGNALDNVLVGGAGNDTYAFDTDSALGTDTVTEAAGAGTDTLDFSNSTNVVTVDLNTIGNQAVNSNLMLNMTAPQIENIAGGSNDDVLTGNGLDNVFDGGAGNDVLNGGDGNNTLNGGDGNDSLTAGAGSDALAGGNDDDTYIFNTNSALGIDTIDEIPGGGTDTLDFSASSNAITVDLGTTGNQVVNGNLTLNMTAAQVENVSGGSNDDTLTGNTLNNVISGGDGNDSLEGGDGNDVLDGGAGNDTLTTSAGVDTLDGGAGDDLLIIGGTHTAGDSVDGGTGTNIFRFGSGTTGALQLISNGTDTLDFSLFGTPVTIDLSNSSQQDAGGGLLLTLSGFFDIVYGSIFDDHITGNSADNTFYGGDGNDTLEGGDGADALNGEAGNDVLDGGAGMDALDGGAGTDMVQNYSAGDTHVNIENGFPVIPASGSRNSHPQSGLSSFIPVTGGTLTLLSCEANPAILRTQGNTLVFFYDMCGYSVMLSDSMSADLLATLPNDQTYVGGISITLLNGSEVINENSHGITAKLRITDPSDLGKTITALYWEITADNGAGAWVEVPVVVADGYATLELNNSGSYVLTAK